MDDNETKQSTSFRQFEFCPLCKVNHKKRKKHIYSKHHQQILQNIVQKFSAKIQSVKQNLFNPRVEESEFEFGAKFWCYFCQSEYLKHDVLELTTVIGAGLLDHLASEEHKTKMEKFFWDNLLEKKLKPRFILSQEDLHIAKKAAFLAVKKFQKAKGIERQKIAERLYKVEQKHRFPAAVGQLNKDEGTRQQPLDLPTTSGQRPMTSYRRTLQASGPGLTSIIQKKEDDDKEEGGNVHTGATPPWLQSDTPSNSRQEIGPTMADYQKHLERERKAKLPATRVGANFDHKTATAADWLPSFGRVWGKGRRLQSKIHFEKEWKGSNKSKSKSTSKQTATATPPPSSTAVYEADSVDYDTVDNMNNFKKISEPVQVKPYQRKSKGSSHPNINYNITSDGATSTYSHMPGYSKETDHSNINYSIANHSMASVHSHTAGYSKGSSHSSISCNIASDSTISTAQMSGYSKGTSHSNMNYHIANDYSRLQHSNMSSYSNSATSYIDKDSSVIHRPSDSYRGNLHTESFPSSVYKRKSSFQSVEHKDLQSAYDNRHFEDSSAQQIKFHPSSTYTESETARSYKRKSERVSEHDSATVPYKRRSDVSSTAQPTQLLQTPLLARYK